MAAAGPEVVPGAENGDPGWLRGIYGGGLGIDGGSYLSLERLALLLYLVVLVCASAIAPRVLWAGSIAAVAAFTLAPPLLSLDVFSYASYARLDALHGLNPYEHPPAAISNADEAVRFVKDWRNQESPYGPLFTLATTPLAHLGLPAFVWTLKALAGLSVLGTAWIASRLATIRGLDPRPALALVALNPLVLVHVVGGGHNDALMMLVLTASVGAVVAGLELRGGIGLVAAVGVKASAAFALPFALVEGLRGRRRLLTGIAAGAAALAAVGLVAFGPAVTEALSVASSNQDLASYASIPATISRDFEIDLDTVRDTGIILFGLLIAGLLIWTVRGGDWIRSAGWAALGLLLASSYVTPWYVILPLPFAAIARDRALVVATVVITAFLLRHQVPDLGG